MLIKIYIHDIHMYLQSLTPRNFLCNYSTPFILQGFVNGLHTGAADTVYAKVCAESGSPVGAATDAKLGTDANWKCGNPGVFVLPVSKLLFVRFEIRFQQFFSHITTVSGCFPKWISGTLGWLAKIKKRNPKSGWCRFIWTSLLDG